MAMSDDDLSVVNDEVEQIMSAAEDILAACREVMGCLANKQPVNLSKFMQEVEDAMDQLNSSTQELECLEDDE